MNVLIALALGAGIGVGAVVMACGVAGRRIFVGGAARGARPGRRLALWAGAAAAGLAVYGATAWIAGGLLAAVAVASGPGILSGRREHQREIALVEAVASWTEMLRDTIAAAAGLEQAITASASVAPAPLALPLARLATRLEVEPLAAALRRFADEVDHPSCDFVVAALVISAEKQARDLGPLLTQLSTCARDDARMRTRIWVDRAKTRTSVRVIAACVVVFAAGLFVFSRRYLEPYDSVGGQVALLLIGALFAVSFVGMDRMARIAVPERFLSRRTP